MKRSGPLLTLLAGGVLAAGIGGLSARAASQDPSRPSAYGSSPNVPTGAAPAASAPGSTSSPAPGRVTKSAAAKREVVKRDYAGHTAGGAATLAIAVRGDKAIAYLCDGRVIEAWLRGSVSAGRFELTGKNGARLTARDQNGKITGSALARGTSFSFTVSSVRRPSGLYRLTARVRGARLDGGWVVLPDGRQVGLLTTNGTPAPAPPLDPATGTVNVNGENVSAGEVRP
jgi:hypothetical protein